MLINKSLQNVIAVTWWVFVCRLILIVVYLITKNIFRDEKSIGKSSKSTRALKLKSAVRVCSRNNPLVYYRA